MELRGPAEVLMAADVSSLIRILNGADATDSPKPTPLITRDLLGGCSPLDSKELDLDMQVPSGWEKRLDLKVYPLFFLYPSPFLFSSSFFTSPTYQTKFKFNYSE